MTAPQHLTITGPEDILGYVPHSLGYWPSRSLVAMTMQGKRLGATLRVDLPEGASSRHGLEDFSRTVAQYLLADDDANGTLLMFFTDDGWTDASGPPGGRDCSLTLKPPWVSQGCPCGTPGMSAPNTGGTCIARIPAAARCPGGPLPRSGTAASTQRWCTWGAAWGRRPGTAPRGDRNLRRIRRCLPRSSAGRKSSAAKGPAGPSSKGCWIPGSRRWRQNQAPPSCPRSRGFLRATLCVPSWRDAVLVMAAAGRPAAVAGAEEFGIFSALPGPPATVPSGMEVPAVSRRLIQPAGAAEPGSSPVRGNGEVPDNQEVPGYGEVLLGLTPWCRTGRG